MATKFKVGDPVTIWGPHGFHRQEPLLLTTVQKIEPPKGNARFGHVVLADGSRWRDYGRPATGEKRSDLYRICPREKSDLPRIQRLNTLQKIDRVKWSDLSDEKISAIEAILADP